MSDLSNNDLSNNDLSNNDLSNNDLSNNDLSNNDLSNNELSNNDLSNNDLSNNDLSNNSVLSEEEQVIQSLYSLVSEDQHVMIEGLTYDEKYQIYNNLLNNNNLVDKDNDSYKAIRFDINETGKYKYKGTDITQIMNIPTGGTGHNRANSYYKVVGNTYNIKTWNGQYNKSIFDNNDSVHTDYHTLNDYMGYVSPTGSIMGSDGYSGTAPISKDVIGGVTDMDAAGGGNNDGQNEFRLDKNATSDANRLNNSLAGENILLFDVSNGWQDFPIWCNQVVGYIIGAGGSGCQGVYDNDDKANGYGGGSGGTIKFKTRIQNFDNKQYRISAGNRIENIQDTSYESERIAARHEARIWSDGANAGRDSKNSHGVPGGDSKFEIRMNVSPYTVLVTLTAGGGKGGKARPSDGGGSAGTHDANAGVNDLSGTINRWIEVYDPVSGNNGHGETDANGTTGAQQRGNGIYNSILKMTNYNTNPVPTAYGYGGMGGVGHWLANGHGTHFNGVRASHGGFYGGRGRTTIYLLSQGDLTNQGNYSSID